MTTRWMRAPSDPEAPDRHHCSPMGEAVYPPDLVGSDMDRWIKHPCIGLEPMAAQCDLVRTEAIIRTLPVEAGVELVRYLTNLLDREPLRSRPDWAEQWKVLEALRMDLMSKPRVAASIDEWTTETEERRRARLIQAHRDAEQEAKSVGQAMDPDPDRPLPRSGGPIG